MWIGYIDGLYDIPCRIPECAGMLPITPIGWQRAVLGSNARRIEVFAPRVCGSTTLLIMDAICRATIPGTTCMILVQTHTKTFRFRQVQEWAYPILGRPEQLGPQWAEYSNNSRVLMGVGSNDSLYGLNIGPNFNLYLDIWGHPEWSRDAKNIVLSRGGRVVEIVHQVAPEDGTTISVMFDTTGMNFSLDDAPWRAPTWMHTTNIERLINVDS